MQRESWQEMWESLKDFLCSEQCRQFLLRCLVKAILCFSIWIQQMLSTWDSHPCVPSATYSSPGAQSQRSCLDYVTRLVGQLISEEDPTWPSGPRLAIVAPWHCKALFFEVCHLQIWPVSSLMETSWWSSPVQGNWAHRESLVTASFKHRPKLQAFTAPIRTVF